MILYDLSDNKIHISYFQIKCVLCWRQLQFNLMPFFFLAKVWEKVIALSSEDSALSDLQIQPTCLGERTNPNLTASMSNIHVGNLQLGQVFRALCRGLIENLHRWVRKLLLFIFKPGFKLF